MKKVVLLFISLIVFQTNARAEEVINPTLDKKEVKLINCESATTSWYEIDGKVKRVRLLAYDREDGELNEEIDSYACTLLTYATKIEIEYDLKSLEKDKYNRDVAWIYVDGKLLQEELIKKGYGQVNYINDEYQYLSELCDVEKEALISKNGIWNYSGIKEKYCKSGINIDNEKKEESKDNLEEKTYDTKELYYLLLLNSGIVLLSVLLVKRG